MEIGNAVMLKAFLVFVGPTPDFIIMLGWGHAYNFVSTKFLSDEPEPYDFIKVELILATKF